MFQLKQTCFVKVNLTVKIQHIQRINFSHTFVIRNAIIINVTYNQGIHLQITICMFSIPPAVFFQFILFFFNGTLQEIQIPSLLVQCTFTTLQGSYKRSLAMSQAETFLPP